MEKQDFNKKVLSMLSSLNVDNQRRQVIYEIIKTAITKIINIETNQVGKRNENNGEIFNDYFVNNANGKYSHVEGFHYKTLNTSNNAINKLIITNNIITLFTEIPELTNYINKNVCLMLYDYRGFNYSRILTNATLLAVDNKNITFDKNLEELFNSLDSLEQQFYLVFSVGFNTGNYSHVEGYNCEGSGDYSHVEGFGCKSTGYASHSGGNNCESTGSNSFTSGNNCTASGTNSFSICYGNTSSGESSYSSGNKTIASGKGSSSNNIETETNNYAETAFGFYNKSTTKSGADKNWSNDNIVTLFSVGNGTKNPPTPGRRNAFEIKRDGTIIIQKPGKDEYLTDLYNYIINLNNRIAKLENPTP